MDGTENRVADCLSCYYEADGPEDHHPDHDFMSAEVKLNPNGELLPIQCYIELRSAVARQSCCLAEQMEQCVLDSIQLNAESSPIPMGPDDDNLPLAIQAGANGQSLCTHVEWQVDLARIVQKHYHEDPVFAKILVHLDAHQQFGVREGLIWTKNQMGQDIVCLPWKAFLRDRRLVEIIIDQAHTMIGHFGQSATTRYIQRYYWWPSMGTDIELFAVHALRAKSRKTQIRSQAGFCILYLSQIDRGSRLAWTLWVCCLYPMVTTIY